ncbi:MAG: hypothetical protein ABI148_05995 [Ginsengibacter sp.]
MKKIIIIAGLFLLAFTAFSQKEETNGTIYIKHPYIDVVMKANQAYLDKDNAANKEIYSDTATWWVTGMKKSIPIADAMKTWTNDFKYFDDIKSEQVGYPDYLHYVDKDYKIVQSWWLWSGKSKKTGQILKVREVMFDEFNNDGKIVRETIFGDFSKVMKDEM